VTWLIHMSECAWHDSFIWVNVRDMTHSYEWHNSFMCVWHDSFVWVTFACVLVSHPNPIDLHAPRKCIMVSYWWYDRSLLSVHRSLLSVCRSDMIGLFWVYIGLFWVYVILTLVIWLVSVCDVTHLCEGQDSFICVPWLVHNSDVTHSYVWQDPFLSVTWLVHMSDMTRLCEWHDSFICVTWLAHMCDSCMCFSSHNTFPLFQLLIPIDPNAPRNPIEVKSHIQKRIWGGYA